MDEKDELQPRVEKVEEDVKELESGLKLTNAEIKVTNSKVEVLETKTLNLDSAVGRIQSHIESELGLHRRDFRIFEEKLFGKGDKEFDGRLGEFSARLGKIEKYFIGAIIAASIVTFLLMIYNVLN